MLTALQYKARQGTGVECFALMLHMEILYGLDDSDEYDCHLEYKPCGYVYNNP